MSMSVCMAMNMDMDMPENITSFIEYIPTLPDLMNLAIFNYIDIIALLLCCLLYSGCEM